MLVSTKGRYGLRMMIDIARHQNAGRVSLREIGERQGISSKYLEQLARLLCSGGMLAGSRGQGGGYVLAKDPGDIRVGDILRSAEGTVAPVACLAHTELECPRAGVCETRGFWNGLGRVIDEYVDSYTLADLVAMQEREDVVPGPCMGYNAAGQAEA